LIIILTRKCGDWTLELKKVKRELSIGMDIARVGAIAFLICIIPAAIYSIVFLSVKLPDVINNGMYINSAGQNTFGESLIYLITCWFFCAIPVPLTTILGRGITYTKRKELIFLMPFLAVALIIAIGIFCFWLGDGLINRWYS
jgi:hypothetical protein